MEWLHSLGVEITALVSMVLLVVTIPWILLTKRDSASAVAWCLLVFFVPIMGSIFFVLFGYQHIHRRLRKKRKHKKLFGLTHAGFPSEIAEQAVLTRPAFHERVIHFLDPLLGFRVIHANLPRRRWRANEQRICPR